jgi:hypothetical protein
MSTRRSPSQCAVPEVGTSSTADATVRYTVIDEARLVHAARWLWPLACVISLIGYLGSWVVHPAAGLAITGLDMGEYAKFVPPVVDGDTYIWRQGFYLPLVAISFACSLVAYRRFYAYRSWLRLALLLLGLVAALNLLPPAWSPAVLITDEFRLQTVIMIVAVAMLATSPVLALLPPTPVYGPLAFVSAAGIYFSVSGLLTVAPSISSLYGHQVQFGAAFYVTIAGLTLLVAACWMGLKLKA